MNDLRHRLDQAATDDGVPLRTDLPDLLRRARADRRGYRARVSLAAAATTAVVLVGGGLAFQALSPDDSTAPDPAQAPSKTTAADPKEEGTWVLPVDKYRITNTFGRFGGKWHVGLDFATRNGAPIKAVASGTVTATGYNGSYGNRIVIKLDDGTELWFGHLSAFKVDKGDQVQAGDLIGYVGSTGNAFGPHVHLEVRPGGGDPVDPVEALAQHGVEVEVKDSTAPDPAEASSDATEQSDDATGQSDDATEQPSDATDADWVKPVNGCRLGDGFGATGPNGVHTGLDFQCRQGKPIRAITDGTITATGYDGAYGNKTVLTLSDGTELWFAHQSATAVSEGDQVEAGEIIGYVGSTGNALGPHLHLEVRPGGGDPVDPAEVLAEHGVELGD